MKKLHILFLSLLLPLVTSVASILKGDVNGDGMVTMADANAVIQKTLGVDVGGFVEEAADVNGDGRIDRKDAEGIVRIFLGMDKATELEEMTGQAMLLKLTSGETVAFETATITNRAISQAGDRFMVTVGENDYSFNTADIEERYYGDMPVKYVVTYDGGAATVVNPYYAKGVTTSIDKADVVINNSNSAEELTFELTGATTDGSLKYNASYKSTVVLNGVSITSSRGAAVDLECGKRVALELKKGTVNTLVDASNGKQKAALYCKGHLEIDKTGTLNVTGNTAHAISAKEYIMLKKSTGTINILGAKSDGIHCKQYFCAKGFTVNISGIEGDGIQAEVEELAEGDTYEEDYENGSIQIVDGNFTITSTTDGGVKTEENTETTKSYKVYVAKTVGTSGGWGGNRGGNYWNNIYLYKADGTLVSTLTNTVTITGTNGQALQFYYYDFGKEDTGTYYFKSDNYTSQGGGGGTTYTIVSSQFTGPQSGIDYYYQISNSYTTSGTKRTFPLSSVQEVYGGGNVESADTYNYNCLKADRLVSIAGGTLVLTNSGTMSKSIKAGNSDYEGTVSISGGDVSCVVSGDMYLSGANATYCAAIKTDNYYGIGGTVNIKASAGKAVRGISADNLIDISGGTYTINNSSNGYLGSNDTYTAKGLTCDKNIVISGGTLTINASGTGGKCIKADGEIVIGDENNNGPVIVASTTGASLGSSSGGGFGGGGGNFGAQQTSTSSSSKAIKAIGQVTVNGGSLTVTTATNGAEGLESKTSVMIKGGNHYFKCYDDCINSAGVINFAGGNTVCYATNNDAVDSNYGRSGAITISGGNVFAYTSAGSPEEGLDCDNNSYIVITGGIAVSAGGSQGGGMGGQSGSSGSVGSASQGYYLGSSPSSYNTTNYYTLYNTSNEAVCTYKFEGSVSNSLSLLTASNLGKGSITVKQGTVAPTACSAQVDNTAGKGVFFIAPTVTTSGTAATVTAK